MTAPVIAASSVDKTGNSSADLVFTTATDGPSGIANGDYLLAIIVHAATATPTIGAPGDWTELSTGGGDGGIAARMSIFYKKITNAGGEPATYTFTGSSNVTTDGMCGKILRISGADADVGPLASPVAVGTGTTRPVVASVPHVRAEALVLAFQGEGHTAVTAHTPPNGYTELFDFSTDPGNAASLAGAKLDNDGVGGSPVSGLNGAAGNHYWSLTVTVNTRVGVSVVFASSSSKPGPVVAEQAQPTAASGASNAAVAVPPGVKGGELLLGFHARGATTSPNASTPAGWSDVAEQAVDGGSAIDGAIHLRQAVEAEAATYNFAGTPTGTDAQSLGLIARIFGADPAVHKLGSWVTATAASVINITGVTTEERDCLVFYAAFAADPAVAMAAFPTVDATLSRIYAALSQPGTAADVAIGVGAMIQAAPGATGTKAITFGTCDSLVGICFALSPAGKSRPYIAHTPAVQRAGSW